MVEWDQQPAGSLDQHPLVSLLQGGERLVKHRFLDGLTDHLGRQGWGSGEGEEVGTGGSGAIEFAQRLPHQLTVQFNIVGNFGTAGLDQLQGGDRVPQLEEVAGQ